MSRRFLVSAALLLASAVVASPVLAQGQDEQGQGQRQRGQRGQRGGFGGFGGMGGGGSMALLNSEQVQNEIELIDEQKTEIEAAQTAMREELQGLFQGGGAGGEEQTDEERQARFAEIQEKMQTATKALQEKIEGEILLPPQVERLKQINIQVRGIASLNDEEVATALSMTDDQKAELTAIQEEMRAQMAELFPGFGQRGQGGPGGQGAPRPQQTDEERQAARDKMTALRTETEAKQLAVLTEEQSAQFEAMKGEPVSFDIAELQGGRGFGGGRGGFGGGGGRGGRGRGGNDGAQQPEQN